MRKVFTFIPVAGLLLGLLGACGFDRDVQREIPENTSLGMIATSTPIIHLPPTETPRQMPPTAVTDLSATYEATPGETIHRLPSPGDSKPHSDLGIGIDTRLEEYVDESGAAVKRWEAMMWLYNEHCYVWQGRTVYIGDVVEFAGYRIRVLDISSDSVALAISGKPLEPLEIAAACSLSIYNTLPSESREAIYRESCKTDSLEFHKGEEIWTEEYVDWNGEIVEGPAIRLRIVSEQQAEAWEGVVHMREIIEFGDYRIRILGIYETVVLLAFGRLSELPPMP